MFQARYGGLGIVALVIVAVGGDAGAADRRGAAAHGASPPHESVVAEVSVCFVPAQECDTAVAAAIGRAEKFIRVQAYGFTAKAVLRALADARGRGVDVLAILDKSDDRADGEGARPLAGGRRFTVAAGIPTWIGGSVAIAHNKAIIIDGHLVIGGALLAGGSVS